VLGLFEMPDCMLIGWWIYRAE